MLWFSIAAVVAIVVGLTVTARYDGADGFAAFFFVGIVLGIVATFLNVGLMKHGTKTKEVVAPVTSIVNLSAGNATSGRGGGFIFYYFVVQTNDRFTYYVKNGDGSFSPDYVEQGYDSDDNWHGVKIFEDAKPNTARLECSVTEITHSHSMWTSVIGSGKDNNECDDYYFHVPPNSVARDFKVGVNG